MKVRIFHHGRCFDGCCSAAVFQRFYRECFDQSAEFIFTPLLHQSGPIFDERQFNGDENVIVDFKYSSSPAVTWWFDHHLSAFLSPEDRAHFHFHRERRFYNPHAKSCAGWIAMIAERDFGFNIAPLQEMLSWADVVDSANYDSPAAAVDLQSPAVKIALAIEAMPDEDFSQNIISMLAYESLEQIVRSPLVRSVLPGLMAQHESSFHTFRKRVEYRNRVVYFDRTRRSKNRPRTGARARVRGGVKGVHP
ncbi:MAG: phosphoesterase, partial [Acidobacteriaceae bacterium]